MALHDLWESGKSRCMTALFFRADSSSLEAGSLNAVCLTVAPICLNTKKTAKKRKSKTLLSMFKQVPPVLSPLSVECQG